MKKKKLRKLMWKEYAGAVNEMIERAYERNEMN